MKGEVGGVQIHAKKHAEAMGARLIQGRFYKFWELRNAAVVHIHYATYHLLVALIARLLFRVPYVVTCHGGDVRLSGKSFVWRSIQDVGFRFAGSITICSKALMDDALKHFEKYRNKMSVVYIGIEHYNGEVLCTGSSVVWVGIDKPAKDIETARKAFSLASKKYPEIDFLLSVGVTHLEALKAIANSVVVVNTSIVEGLPLTVLEAMDMGKAVVASDVGGTSEIIEDGINGFLCLPKRPDLFAQRISYLLDTPALRDLFGRNASETAKGMTWEKTMLEYRRIYSMLQQKIKHQAQG